MRDVAPDAGGTIRPDSGGCEAPAPARSHFAFAVAITALAVLVTFCLTAWLEDFPLLILLTAVIASALRGGTASGLLATGLSACALFTATHSLAEPFAIPRVNLRAEVVRLVIFVIVASGISLMGGARRRAERDRAELLVRERHAREEAEAANLAKDRFLANTSHELRNPLTAILSWTSLLQGDGITAVRVRQGLKAIERTAKAQGRLIDDLLDISRIVNGKLRLETRPMDLAPVVEAAIDNIRDAAEAKGIALEVEQPLSPRRVQGDPERLQQIAWNLLTNAVKFTPEGGCVSISLESSDGYVRLKVVDTGQGFLPEVAPRLFERFWQAERSITQRVGGLGLGLAIVRHLVELQGGTVMAHSAGAGRGATFEVTLPLVADDRESSHDTREADAQSVV